MQLVAFLFGGYLSAFCHRLCLGKLSRCTAGSPTGLPEQSCDPLGESDGSFGAVGAGRLHYPLLSRQGAGALQTGYPADDSPGSGAGTAVCRSLRDFHDTAALCGGRTVHLADHPDHSGDGNRTAMVPYPSVLQAGDRSACFAPVANKERKGVLIL